MRLSRLILLVAGLGFFIALSAPNLATARQTNPAPVPIEEWSLDKISRLGVEIFEQDRAAWLATDVLMAGIQTGALADGRGWIVVPDPGGRKVRFVVQHDDGPYRARWDVVVGPEGAGPLVPLGDGDAGVELKPEEAAQFQARQTAMDNIGRLRCSRNLNTVVFDDPDSDGWLVWLLTSTEDTKIIPVGGHYRFRISTNGKTVLRRDMLSNGCFNAERPSDEVTSQALFFTQIVSNGPVETHVFLSILNHLPIYIMTRNEQVFEVAGSKIADVTEAMKP